MLRAVKSLVESMGGTESVKTFYSKTLPPDLPEHRKQTRMIWDLWARAERSLLYDDNHPGFAQGHWVRVVPQEPGWNIYTDGVNDVHIETALRRIANNLGLMS